MKSANSSLTFSETSLKNFPSPRWEGGCEKIGLVLFDVIPAPYQVRGKLQPGDRREAE